MSREEKDGFTTPKKFAVITPSKERKEEKPKTTLASNSFYSLSKESFHILFLTFYHQKGWTRK